MSTTVQYLLNSSEKRKLGTVLCKDCQSVIDVFEANRVLTYFSSCTCTNCTNK
ncbi:GapA-binding peptide SR1P [Alkalihalobacillus alcalophilus]|uniref:GapA-binding peptide SR1P n=1 Tax=Alkalihalobacillus alcalophilus TaxID=1445 RepID=UPI0010A5EEAC|nr:GapA-binding peptide SR1P [Alkalihalobacillus alcalophilus]MED1560534.1 GapA-binding peptide SR1P [Alkalihalobacillus alcalophilus]